VENYVINKSIYSIVSWRFLLARCSAHWAGLWTWWLHSKMAPSTKRPIVLLSRTTFHASKTN